MIEGRETLALWVTGDAQFAHLALRFGRRAIQIERTPVAQT